MWEIWEKLDVGICKSIQPATHSRENADSSGADSHQCSADDRPSFFIGGAQI